VERCSLFGCNEGYIPWLLEKQTGLNLPAAPEGVWFFNPLAWQFLFFIGACCARPRSLLRMRPLERRIGRNIMMPAALAFLAASLLLGTRSVFRSLLGRRNRKPQCLRIGDNCF